MSENQNETVVAANVSTSKASLVFAWIVPIIAALIAGWLVWRSIPETSAIVTLTAPKADGLSATNTQVKYRGVPIGIVTQIVLEDDLGATRLTIELDEGYEEFAKAGAQYWIVRPEFSTGNLESLRTIVSGPYIAAQPGDGNIETEFDVLPHPPVSAEESIGARITLLLPHLQSIKRSTRISWRGKAIGQVLDTRLNQNGQQVHITVGLAQEYLHLVRKNSVFWNSGGLDVEFGLFSGAEVRAESMQALLQGDISVATPEEPGAHLEGGEVFTLYPKPERNGSSGYRICFNKAQQLESKLKRRPHQKGDIRLADCPAGSLPYRLVNLNLDKDPRVKPWYSR